MSATNRQNNHGRGLISLGARIAWRYRMKILFFASCIAIGIAFLFSIGNLVTTVSDEICGYARELLTADIAISSSRPFDDKQEKIIRQLRPGAKISAVCWFLSMLRPDKKESWPFLVTIKAVDHNYPLYGELQVKPPDYRRIFFSQPSCLIDSYIAQRHKLAVNDQVKLGRTQLKIAGIIQKEPQRLLTGIAFAPSVIIPASIVKQTGLVGFGSRVRYRRLLALPQGHNRHRDVQQAMADLEKALVTPHLRITSYANAQNNIQQILKRQSTFFLLVAIVTLLVGAVGMGASVTTFLNEQLETVGTLRCLGVGPTGIFRLYLGLCLVIGIFAGIFGSIVGVGFNYFAVKILMQLLSLKIEIPVVLHWQYLVEGLVTACLLTVGINFHKVRSLARISPMDILRGKVQRLHESLGPRIATAILIMAAIFFYIRYKADSWKMALFFSIAVVVVVAAVLLLIWLAVSLVAVVLKKIHGRSHLVLVVRNGLRQLVRQKARTWLFLLSLTIGFSLIQSLNLVYHSLATEVTMAQNAQNANVFLIDVQKDQLAELQQIANNYTNGKINLAPLVRARLTHINSQPVQRRTGEKMFSSERRRYRWRTREQNLTYKDRLNSSEMIVAGKFWSENDKKVQVSIEQSFAQRAEIQLGDRLRFDIQGREIEGPVTSIRKIDWISMKPNFFMAMPTRALDKAPQIFIASLYIADSKKISAFQKQLLEKFPNIAVINVSKIIATVRQLLGYFLAALQITAWFCVGVGALILIGTFSIGHQQRLDDVALLRTLGCNKSTIVLIDTSEFLGIGFLTAAIAGSFSYLLALAVTEQMEISFHPYIGMLGEIILMILLPLLVGLAVNWRTYGASVMVNLRKGA